MAAVLDFFGNENRTAGNVVLMFIGIVSIAIHILPSEAIEMLCRGDLFSSKQLSEIEYSSIDETFFILMLLVLPIGGIISETIFTFDPLYNIRNSVVDFFTANKKPGTQQKKL